MQALYWKKAITIYKNNSYSLFLFMLTGIHHNYGCLLLLLQVGMLTSIMLWKQIEVPVFVFYKKEYSFAQYYSARNFFLIEVFSSVVFPEGSLKIKKMAGRAAMAAAIMVFSSPMISLIKPTISIARAPIRKDMVI